MGGWWGDTSTNEAKETPHPPLSPSLFHCLRGKNEIQREINSFVSQTMWSKVLDNAVEGAI